MWLDSGLLLALGNADSLGHSRHGFDIVDAGQMIVLPSTWPDSVPS